MTSERAWKPFAQLAAGLVGLFVVVGFAGHAFRDELEVLGRWFIERAGYVGMGIGTFLADGLHFPIPPQFYMLAVIVGGGSAARALVAIAIGSLAGGHVAYFVASKARHIAWIRRRADLVARKMAALVKRHGAWAMVLGSLLPVPYSFLCYLSGLNRLPYRLFALLCLLRLPKIVAFYWLIAAGWSV